ncbi:hypothetical protein JKP88DRAFT_254301 [Tribonema minus]|uniref:Uncharacterized protein n=1 Tax=Tribonema minus TaxID=303371 RepID=A0A835Z8P4_9STRA|nr:hypothetical protein JKP88DRAFT_254301 [Tribonema minus]
MSCGVLQVAQRRVLRASSNPTAITVNGSNSGHFGVSGRVQEMQRLHRLGLFQPASIAVLSGPPGCGKTAVLQAHAAQQQQLHGNTTWYNSARNACTPALLGQAVATRALPDLVTSLPEATARDALGQEGWAAWQHDVAGSTKEFAEAKAAGPAALLQYLSSETLQGGPPGLYQVFQPFMQLLQARKEAHRAGTLAGPQQAAWPMLIIDDADVLLEWERWYPEHLKRLFYDFVTLTCKSQGQSCNVLLVTSSTSFGCDHDSNLAKLSKALDRIVQSPMKSVQNALDPDRYAYCNSGHTAAPYAEAALHLLDSPYNAVTVTDMELRLGRHLLAQDARADTFAQRKHGHGALAALVRYGKLALRMRPLNDFKSDVPQDAWGGSGELQLKRDDMVTAPSPVHLHCMRLLQPQLRAVAAQRKF